MWLAAASTSVLLSVVLATAWVPTVPPAPGRFSTITVAPSACPSSALNVRATASCTAPGPKGTTMRMMRSAASAGVAAAAAKASARTARRVDRYCMGFSLSLGEPPLREPHEVAGADGDDLVVEVERGVV